MSRERTPPGIIEGVDRPKLLRIIARQRKTKNTAQDVVLASIRQAILAGALPPGARLRQEDLAEVFGTSRTPVREALRALEYEGLVTSEPHRGSTATRLDADEVDEVYDLRIVLEGHAVRLAVPLLTDDDLERLDGLFDRMQSAVTPDEQLEAREHFYLQLFSVTGRPRLVGLIMRLRQEVARVLRWTTIQHSSSMHQEFWEAARTGNADRAVRQLSKHYRRVAGRIRRHIKEANNSGRTSPDHFGL